MIVNSPLFQIKFVHVWILYNNQVNITHLGIIKM